MEDGLLEILELPGVENCLVFNNQGEALYNLGREQFTDEELQEMGQTVLSILGSMDKSQHKHDNLDFIYENGRILIRDMEKAALTVFTNARADLSLTRMTINIINQGWKENQEIQKMLKKNTVERVLGEEITPPDEGFLDG